MYQVAKFSRLLAKRKLPYVFSGAGDVVSGAKCWWGLRAYTTALIGNTVIRLRRDSDNAEQDFVTVTGGGLDLTSISSFKSSANLFVVTLYDQLTFDNLTNSTAATQPQFILSGIGSKPVMRFTATLFLRSGTDIQMTQPHAFSSVAKRTGSVANMLIIGDTNGSGVGFKDVTNNVMGQVVGTPLVAGSAAESSFHALTFTANGASSELSVNGTVTTGNPGSGNYGGGSSRTDFNVNRNLVGDVVEAGIWDNAFTSGQSSSMSTNQHDYWGF